MIPFSKQRGGKPPFPTTSLLHVSRFTFHGSRITFHASLMVSSASAFLSPSQAHAVCAYPLRSPVSREGRRQRSVLHGTSRTQLLRSEAQARICTGERHRPRARLSPDRATSAREC